MLSLGAIVTHDLCAILKLLGYRLSSCSPPDLRKGTNPQTLQAQAAWGLGLWIGAFSPLTLSAASHTVLVVS